MGSRTSTTAVGRLAEEIAAIGASRVPREHHIRHEVAPAARAAEHLKLVFGLLFVGRCLIQSFGKEIHDSLPK